MISIPIGLPCLLHKEAYFIFIPPEYRCKVKAIAHEGGNTNVTNKLISVTKKIKSDQSLCYKQKPCLLDVLHQKFDNIEGLPILFNYAQMQESI